jgi:hypothetical protein
LQGNVEENREKLQVASDTAKSVFPKYKPRTSVLYIPAWFRDEKYKNS